jgi:hypothetical protein
MAFTKKIDGGLGTEEKVDHTRGSAAQATMSVQEILRKEPKVGLFIHLQEGQEGKEDVRIGIDGYVFNVKRGFWVDVPQSVIKNLETCTYTIVSQVEDGQGGTNETRTEVPRFSYSTRAVSKTEPEGQQQQEQVA